MSIRSRTSSIPLSDHPTLSRPTRNDFACFRVPIRVTRGASLAMTTVQPMRSNRLFGKNILIVEDEPLLAHDYEESIRGCGASIVGPFSTTRDALDALAGPQGGVDIALVDHALRDGPSVELQQRLRSLNIPFLVLTGYPRVLVRDAENRENLLSKPVTGVELCEALGSICS